MRKFLIPISFSLVFLCGCTVYQPNVRQGNIVELEQFEQIKPGMTRKQVEFILGTALLIDPFRRDRWDYVYFTLNKKTRAREFQRITLFFEDDILQRVEGGVTVPDFKPSTDS